MALFKPFRGTRVALPQELHDGYAYFCTDDGSFHIDYVDYEGNLQRKQVNAKDAETLCGMSLDEIKSSITVTTDQTLTQVGAPADAKITGDRICSIEDTLSDIPTPGAADSGKYLRVNTAGEWELQSGDTSGGGGSAVSSANYVEHISDGATDIAVAATNNTIFSIQGYTSVTIIEPEDLDDLSIWECYFYVHFSDSADVSLTLPADMRCNGDSPSYVKPGDIWEISINKQGGAVCLRT